MRKCVKIKLKTKFAFNWIETSKICVQITGTNFPLDSGNKMSIFIYISIPKKGRNVIFSVSV